MKICGLEGFKATYFAHYGSDLTPVQAAKVSTNTEAVELDDKAVKLLKYLAKNKHMSPFEMADITFIIECPIFIRSQVHRHRTFSYNEWSGMYSVVGEQFYIPKDFHKQGKRALNLPTDKLSDKEAQEIRDRMEIHILRGHELYEFLLKRDITRDLSRLILGQNMMTKFFMKGNLRNWMQYLQLRCAEEAHFEHQYLADMIFKELIKMFPVSVGTLAKSMFDINVLERLGIKGEQKNG